jgi:hypothetical protein
LQAINVAKALTFLSIATLASIHGLSGTRQVCPRIDAWHLARKTKQVVQLIRLWTGVRGPAADPFDPYEKHLVTRHFNVQVLYVGLHVSYLAYWYLHQVLLPEHKMFQVGATVCHNQAAGPGSGQHLSACLPGASGADDCPSMQRLNAWPSSTARDRQTSLPVF